MSKAVKDMITAELRGRYEGVTSACVVDITGMNVLAQEKLRKTLRGKSARLEVIKNSLARQAFRDGALAPLGDRLVGPCALVTSSESTIEVAKALLEAAKEFTTLRLKEAIFDGDARTISIEALSRMRGRREILAEVAMLIGSPGRAIAACLQSPQAKIAGCLKAIADRAA